MHSKTNMDSKTKDTMWKVLGGGILLIFIAFMIWLFSLPKLPADEVAAYNGLHWHAQLNIKIKGEPITIPANVGTDGSHVARPHTHNADNILHYEIPGIARVKDLTLSKFFESWEKPFSSTCILDTCVTGTSTIKMTVNGTENTLYEKYPIKDKDLIEIVVE